MAPPGGSETIEHASVPSAIHRRRTELELGNPAEQVEHGVAQSARDGPGVTERDEDEPMGNVAVGTGDELQASRISSARAARWAALRRW